MTVKAVLNSSNDLNNLTNGIYVWNTDYPQNIPVSQGNGVVVVFEGNMSGVYYNFQICSLPGRVLYYRRKKGNASDTFAEWARVTAS